MAVAVLTPSLTDDVLNDNHRYDVPDSVYEEQFLPILKNLELHGIKDPSKVEFDPAKHISFTDEYLEKTKRYTMEELGLTKTHQKPISPIGVTEKFPLFTDEAVAILRWELMQKEVIKKGGRIANQSNTGNIDLIIRAYNDEAKFTHQAWSHPKTMEIVSKMAGVKLAHMFDYEMVSVNVSIKTEASQKAEEKPAPINYDDPESIKGIVSWHFDSPQVSCVLMLSDTSRMIGGETSLIKGDGKLASVPNPIQGWASIIQGRVVKHIAPKPQGDYTERITQVSSYRAADPMLENCVMTTIKPGVLSGSRYNEWYKGWMNYRLDVLSKRIEVLREEINTSIDKGEKFDQIKTINFIQKNLVEYAERSWQEFEVVDDGLVEKPASYNVLQSRWD